MKKSVVCLLVFCLLSIGVAAQSGDRGKIVGRVDEAGAILNEIMSAPDSGIPSGILGSAECVAVIPSMLKGAFGFGGVYGRGVASCRTATGWRTTRLPSPPTGRS